ncbi:MAG: hypothetical protein H8E55_66215 [Pelagibacterales bacterium]|nr:hypothetical protein [Pelagibacterales bacterium]
MSKFSSPFLAKSPLNNGKLPKRGRIQSSEFVGLGSDTKIANTKINDPKNILTRPRTRKEFKRGYRYKTEDDGSLTLKGRKKVSTKTKDGHHAWVGVKGREDLQARYQ